jgi:hypothetical protein
MDMKVHLETIEEWLSNNPLDSIYIDCCIAVMLKIMDGKCKMDEHEKVIMSLLYTVIKNRNGHYFKSDIHDFIEVAKTKNDDEIREQIYEKRVLAETVIARPTMKRFKAMIRNKGLL